MENQQYKYMTPAETLILMTAKIIKAGPSKASIGTTHYRNKCEYKKLQALLLLALAGHLGAITNKERERIDSSLEKLDEMYEQNRRLPKPAPAEKSPGLFN